MESVLIDLSASHRRVDRRSYVHTLSLRLLERDYRRLRHFVTEREDRLGQRISHQSVLEAALLEYLSKNTDTAE